VAARETKAVRNLSPEADQAERSCSMITTPNARMLSKRFWSDVTQDLAIQEADKISVMLDGSVPWRRRDPGASPQQYRLSVTRLLASYRLLVAR
jgi:hypothetical protein